MRATAHKIVGTEVFGRGQLLPGYGALRIGETRPFNWGWRHTGALATLMVAGLTALGVNGLLP